MAEKLRAICGLCWKLLERTVLDFYPAALAVQFVIMLMNMAYAAANIEAGYPLWRTVTQLGIVVLSAVSIPVLARRWKEQRSIEKTYGRMHRSIGSDRRQ